MVTHLGGRTRCGRGARGALWQTSVSGASGDGPVYLPGEPVLTNQLRGRLPLVAVTGRQAEVLRLLRWQFDKAPMGQFLKQWPWRGPIELSYIAAIEWVLTRQPRREHACGANSSPAASMVYEIVFVGLPLFRKSVRFTLRHHDLLEERLWTPTPPTRYRLNRPI
jgi:hypothetical protein